MPINDTRQQFIGESPNLLINDTRGAFADPAPKLDLGGFDLGGALKETGKDIAMLPVEAADFLGGFGSGMTAWVASQLAGKGTAIGAKIFTDLSSEEARATGESVEESVANFMIYHPQTERGKAGVEIVGRAIDWSVGRGAEQVDHELSKIDPVLGYVYGLFVEYTAFHTAGIAGKGLKPKIAKVIEKLDKDIIKVKETGKIESISLDKGDLIALEKIVKEDPTLSVPVEEFIEWQKVNEIGVQDVGEMLKGEAEKPVEFRRFSDALAGRETAEIAPQRTPTIKVVEKGGGKPTNDTARAVEHDGEAGFEDVKVAKTIKEKIKVTPEETDLIFEGAKETAKIPDEVSKISEVAEVRKTRRKAKEKPILETVPRNIRRIQKKHDIEFISSEIIEGETTIRWFDNISQKRFTSEGTRGIGSELDTLREKPKKPPKAKDIEAQIEDIGVRATEGEDLAKLEEEALGITRLAEPESPEFVRAQDFLSIIRKMKRQKEAGPIKQQKVMETQPLKEKISKGEDLTAEQAASRAGEELEDFSKEGPDPDIGRSASEVSADLVDLFRTGGEEGALGGSIKKMTAAEREVVGRLMADAKRAGRSLKDMLKEAGFKDDIADKIDKIAKQLEERVAEKRLSDDIKDLNSADTFMAKVDIEAPFKKDGAPETGFHTKNYYSVRSAFEEEGLVLIKNLSKKKLTKEQYADAAILAQKKDIVGDTPVHEVARTTQEYFRSSFQELKDIGVLQTTFPDEMINRLRAKNTDLSKRIEKSSGDPKNKERQVRIDNNKELIKKLKNMDFVHIPTTLWFDRMASSDPVKFKKILSFLTIKKRHTIDIQDLIDKKLINKSDIDIRDIVGNYARRKGKDIAIARIINAAKEEGLIIDKWKKGYDRISAKEFPMLKQKYAAPYFLEYMKDFIGFYNTKPGIVHDILTTSKGFQFFNPLFLPFYDAYQAFIGGSLRSYRALLPTKNNYIYRAMKSTVDKDANYWRSLNEGLSSKPFNNPWNNFWDLVESSKRGYGGRILNSVVGKGKLIAKHKVTGIPRVALETMKDIYGVSWNTAWYLDRAIRSISYEFLIDRGLSPREAAQTAALWHADYASVPPRLRRMLNHVFFTPTFKIAMTKLYANLVSGAIKSANVFDLSHIKNKSTRLAAKGAIAIVAVNAGYDLIMKGQGFEKEGLEDWGVKYFRTVDTDEGPRELVIPISHPANLLNKYIGRIIKAAKPGGDPFVDQVVRSFKWEINPVWRLLAFDLRENRQPDGTPIYREGSSTPKKGLDILKYLTGQIVRLTAMVHASKEDEKVRKAAIKEFGLVASTLMRPFTGRYLRRIGAERSKFRIEDIKGMIRRDTKDGVMTNENMKRYLEMIGDLQDEIK